MMANRDVRHGVPVIFTNLALAFGLVGLDVIARLVPHAPNFTPVAASALFAGATLRSPALAFTVPLAAMVLGDGVLGFNDWCVTVVVYAAIAMPAMLGVIAKRSATYLLALPFAVTSSVVFFVATNWAVWMFSGIYPRGASGLLKCYIAAIPFFQNTLLGDLVWTIILFGLLWAWRAIPQSLKARRLPV
jgi:hypothetical protein